MTETKLPEELEEQAMLHALGILDSEDRQAFLVRLQGESKLLRDAVVAYQATMEALAVAVAPVTPPSILRKRLVNQIASEAARESGQFELAADTLALGAVPMKPRHALREQLLSRIEGHSDIRLAVTAGTSVTEGDGLAGGDRAALRRDGGGQPASQVAQSWRHFLVTSYLSLQLCWKAFRNFLRTIVIRPGSSDHQKLSSAGIGFERPGAGFTFITAADGIWRELAPGVTAKVLSFDMVSRRVTTLLRIAPGGRYAPHRHTEMEELFVLEGGCSIAGREMTVGDYHRAEAGTEHHDTSSDDGCLLLVISSPQNEMLP